MGRKILFITTDQQRYDALGCNGGTVARTPVIDAPAAEGIVFDRAHVQSVVCMPSRATIVTGQYARMHGVWMNGVPLPSDARSVAAVLGGSGYRTALIGKAHFEPTFDLELRFPENRMGAEDTHGPYRGFDRMELATHSPLVQHYGAWMREHHPDEQAAFYPVLDEDFQVNALSGGETGAPQVKRNPVPREHYHTDWVADRAIAWLDSLPADVDWFCWVSFPDPHHPWDPPASEAGRVSWRDLDLPAGYPETEGERRRIIEAKPRHWRSWYEGESVYNFEAPARWTPASLTADQVREVNALVHVKNELVDEACGRILRAVAERGWEADTDVFYCADHGEFQGDYGLLFKGPYHVDALMRVPLIWRPAPSTGAAPVRIDRPVGLVDLAPTWCRIAGTDVPDWMQGSPLPATVADARSRERVITEWDSEYGGVDIHLRTIHRDGFTCTICERGTMHDGTEGELYDLTQDPHQHQNLWDDPQRRPLRDDLVADLLDHLPQARAERLAVVAPV